MGKRKFCDKEGASKKSKLQKIEGADDETAAESQADEINTIKATRNNSFDIKHFRKELAAKQGQTVALTQFLQVCLNPDNEDDPLLQYLQAGGNSHEILRQVPADSRKNLTLATPAFHLFHLIILKVQSSLPHMIAVTEEACRYFLNNFTSTVEIMISENSGPRHRKIILKLFTSMVTLNPDLGIEVLNQAPLTPKHLQHILEKPNYKEKDNVRTAFVHFMTSFIVEGHLPLIKALLEKQGLLPLVVPGLVQDEAEAVLMFINILKKNIVDNALISKSLKLKTFSHNVLHQIFKVYFWKGPPDSSNEVINEFRLEITSLLSDILLTLFTSHKLGLYFVDGALGTTDANKNQNLYKALLTLKRPWENKSQCEIVLEIVYRCPDLHRAVVSLIEQSFEPQHSSIWEKSVEFFSKLMDKLKPEEMIKRFSNLNSAQVANFVRFTTLPVPLLKFVQSSLGKTDQTISLHCIKVLVKMLNTLKRYMQILGMENSQALIVDLKNKLEYFFPKHVPAPATIVSIINQIIKGSQKKEIKASQDYKLPLINEADALISLIDLLLLYNDIHPAHFESLEGNLDMKEILEFSIKLTDGPVSILKFKIVSLWLTLDNTAVSLKNPLFKDLFQIMLQVYTSQDDDTWIEAKETIFKFFKNTSIFEADEDEIHIILYTLRNCNVDTSIIGDIFEDVLERNKDLTEYVRNQMVHFEISNENNEANLEKLLDDLMEGTNTEGTCFLERKIPSPFIVGCIQYCQNNKDAKKNLKQFLSVYIANLLHCNYTPELTEILIGDSKLEVRKYVASWIVEPAAPNETIVGKDATLNNIAEVIVSNKDLALTDIFPFIEESSLEECDVTIQNTHYKVKAIHIDSSELLIWAKYLIFCTVRLANIDQLQELRQKKINDLLLFIIEFAKTQHKADLCRTIILNLFKNPHVLSIYSPIDLNQNSSSILATNFILQVIGQNRNMVDFVDKNHNILKAFQQKNYIEIVKAIIKIKKKKNVDSLHTVNVLETVGMTTADSLKTLNQIFDIDRSHCVRDDKEPSLVLEITRVLVSKYSRSRDTDLAPEVLHKVINLYTKLLTEKETTVTPNLTNIEVTLIDYFEHKPHHVKLVTKENFIQFFHANAIRKTTSQLAATILKFNSKLCGIFKGQIERKEILTQRELTLPLGNAILEHKKFLSENQEFLKTIFNEYKSNIFKLLEKPHKAGQIYVTCWPFIRKLVLECVDLEDCQKMFNKSHKFEVVELSHLYLFQAMFLRLCVNPDAQKKEHLINYFLTMLNTITMALKECKNASIVNEIVTAIFTVNEISKSLPGLRANGEEDYKRFTESSIWQNFCKAVLKDSLKVKTNEDEANVSGPKLLCLLSKLVELIYPDNHEDIVTLFDMVTSHSEFLKVMLSHSSLDIKSRLIEFLYTLLLKNKSVMKSQQIPVYLSAYHATKSQCDRLLLTVLHFYEANDLPVHEYKPYLFGDSAANYYAVRKNKTSSLWAHPTPNQILSLFDKETVERTVRNFPVMQKLSYNYELPPNIHLTNDCDLQNDTAKVLLNNLFCDGVLEPSAASDTESSIQRLILTVKYDKTPVIDDVCNVSHCEEDTGVYDPTFVLPLLSHVLAPGSAASCFRLLRGGLLSLPVAGLGSHCADMRAAAYHVLHRFSMLLETETRHKNDKLLLTDFVDMLRQSLSSAVAGGLTQDGATREFNNPRLPALNALYLAKALRISTASFDPLFKPVNNFLIAKHHVDLTVVPDFLSLFHDSDVESAERRVWILEVIRDGTKTLTDVNVVFKTMCVKMIMDFYSSVLSDRKSKDRILGVVASMVAIPRAFDILYEGYGLMSWLHGVVRRLGKDDKVPFRRLLEIIRNMLYSMYINALTKSLSFVKRTEKSVLDIKELRMNKDLDHDILILLYDMTNLVEILEIEDLILFVKTYNILPKKTVKFLSKRQVLNLISVCKVNTKGCDNLDLLSTALATNCADLLKSKTVNETENDGAHTVLYKELTKLVKSYLL